MSKTLYLECASGISGDMTVAALLDLGADRRKLDSVLASLNLDGFEYTVSQKKSYGIAGCDFDVQLHHHEHHHHGHSHEHHHHHEHRNLADVNTVIDRGKMTDSARALAKRIFQIVADAEAKAHGCPIDEVHFHEVGAIDSIVDIVAAAVLIDDLQITDCIVPGLTEGSGTVHCQHGDLPVPVPAVLNIAQAHKIPLRPSDTRGEMVTPTGIAIAAALRTGSKLPESYTIDKVGIGLGKRDFGHANMLRAMLITPAVDPEKNVVLETNIDDSTGETLGFAMEKLFAAGALDVCFIPCFMKKNRPAYLLQIIAQKNTVPVLEKIIFTETTAIGLRKYPVERACMDREILTVQLPCGPVKVKKCSRGDIVRFYPEYDSVKALAEQTGKPFREIFELAELTAKQ